MAGPTIEVAPPLRHARVGGLGSVVELRPNERLGMTEGLVFQSDGCTFPKSELARCVADAPQPDKTFDGIEIEGAIGAPLVLYGGVSCFAGPDADHAERARRILDEGQDRAAEDVLETWAAGATALANGGSVTGAVALVEQELDDKYVGRGVILMSRADAVRGDAEGSLYTVGGQIQTINGTPVIASGRVTPGTVYGLGGITVEHSAITEHDVIEPVTNKHYAIAEGLFAILVDCEFRTKSATTA